MKSEEKIDVIVKPMYGKEWMIIRIKTRAGKNNNEFVPSFHDWWRMLKALVYCEKRKYKFSPDPVRMIRNFFNRCFDGAAWEDLRKEFKIPNRE